MAEQGSLDIVSRDTNGDLHLSQAAEDPPPPLPPEPDSDDAIQMAFSKRRCQRKNSYYTRTNHADMHLFIAKYGGVCGRCLWHADHALLKRERDSDADSEAESQSESESDSQVAATSSTSLFGNHGVQMQTMCVRCEPASSGPQPSQAGLSPRFGPSQGSDDRESFIDIDGPKSENDTEEPMLAVSPPKTPEDAFMSDVHANVMPSPPSSPSPSLLDESEPSVVDARDNMYVRFPDEPGPYEV